MTIVKTTSSAHTPGPWFTEPHNLTDCGNWLVRQDVPFGPVVAEVDPLPESEANAWLIAAAPDLLIAVVELLNCPDLKVDGLDDITIAAINHAYQAIECTRR